MLGGMGGGGVASQRKGKLTFMQRIAPGCLQIVIYASRAAIFTVLIVALKFRFGHPGSVCSGDYLEASDAP